MLARVSHTHYKLPRATESWMAVSEQGYGYKRPRMSHSEQGYGYRQPRMSHSVAQSREGAQASSSF